MIVNVQAGAMRVNTACDNCGKCCLNTEMLLSNPDVALIKSQIGVKRKDFVLKEGDGFMRLKNRDGRCMFYDPSHKNCTIYEFRPMGCRLYPLVYNLATHGCEFDEDCPNPNGLYWNGTSVKEACGKLKSFLRDQLRLSRV